MVNVFLRPDIKTVGGEVNDILLNGRYVGSMSLVYRENERISGSVQLEEPSMPDNEKENILDYVDRYIQAFADAIQAEDYSVPVTYSAFDCFIEPFDELRVDGINDINLDEASDGDVQDEDEYLEDIDPDEIETLDMDKGVYELVIVDESRRKVEYHIYDEDQEWVAEAVMRINGDDVYGEVRWMFDPTEEEIEDITELLVSDFDEEQIDTFVINHNHDNEIVETIDLTHNELLDNDTEQAESDDYTIVLARDDEDTLTYEIFQQSRGGLPIGTATVDISRRVLTGFIDFRDPASNDDLDTIAALLMQELDKEKEYDGINLTMLYQNEPIDEMIIECDQVH
jgi:hypothetical protein